jgi:hypothetical protein
MYLRETGWKYDNRMHLVQNTDRRRAHVNTVMKPLVSLKAGNFLTR